jgi:2-polyprenyl-6-methoxyphenol hydroxylase-like FAD-dependent oxidoreductase
MATIGGRHGDVPPGDAEGFLNYASALRTPTIYNAVRHAKHLDKIARYGFPESVRLHFERLDVFPRGLLPIGDAICRFNPVYGQGMSVAALEACLLKTLLESLGEARDPMAELAPTFFAEMQALIETPWSVAALDFAFPETRGQRPADFETTLKFGIALTRLAAEDPAVHRLTVEVQHLLKPRSVYRDPTLVQRVFAKMAEA